jgi:outer membrane protein assembly factor BamB
VWKLNGATGERIWAHVPEMDEAVVARSFFSHTRGLAIGDGRVYMGLADGRVIALDEKTGEVLWDKQLVNSKKDTAGFSGAGTFVNADLFVIGQNAGEFYRRVEYLHRRFSRVNYTGWTAADNLTELAFLSR